MANVRTFVAAMLCAAVFSSCVDEMESTYVGFQDGIPVSEQSMNYEDLKYGYEFGTTVNELFTVEQYVEGNEVHYEGEEVIEKIPFFYDLNLGAKFSANPEQVYVLDKEHLSLVSMTSSKAGEETLKSSTDNGFTLTSAEREYEFVFNEGEQVSVKSVYEKVSRQDTTFAYAKISRISYKNSDSELNEAKSNADSLVHNVNLYFDVEVIIKSAKEETKTYTVSVPIERIYKEAPAEAVTEMKDVEYKGVFAVKAKELYTVEQYIQGYYVTSLKGEEIGRNMFKYGLNLNVKFENNPEEVFVGNETALSDVSLKSVTTGEEKQTEEKQDEFTKTKVEQEYDFEFNEGEKVSAKSVYESLKNEETKFGYAEIRSVTYKKYEALENKAETNEDKIVYDINLYFEVDVVGQEGADVSNKYEIVVTYKRIYAPVKPDTYDTVMENVDYEGEFDTQIKQLFTVKQNVTGEFVTYKNQSEEVSREGFTRKLNLEALFDVPSVVYVENEESLATVSLAGSSKDGNKENNTSSDGFTTTKRLQNYNFRFNSNERVVSSTEYERETYGESTFVYSSIENVSYKTYEAVKNEAKSNADSTVYDVVLYFNVDVKRKDVNPVENFAAKTHLVAVPYMKVFKHEVVEVPDVLVKKEYRDVQRKIISSTSEKVSFTEYEVWSVSGEKNVTTISMILNFGFSNPQEQTVYTENTNYVTNSNGVTVGRETSKVDGSWTVYTKTGSYSSTADNAHKSFNNEYSYNSQKAVYKNEYYTVNFDYGTWSVSEAGSNVGVKSGETTYNGKTYEVYPYVNNVRYAYDVVTDSYNGNGQSRVNVCVKKEEDLLVEKGYRNVQREILSATTERVSFTEYEIWSLSGEKNVRTISKVLNFGFKNPSAQTVYTTNTNYMTASNGSTIGKETSSKDGSWTVYTKTGSYSSTADNAHKSFNNEYSYNSQKAVYKNDYYTVSFDYGTWSVSEAGSNVGAKSGETIYNGKVYDVYPYVNNVSYVYDVVTDSYNANGKADRNICIEKPIDPIVPASWGKIIGAGISAVPADDVSGSYAKKCLCIRTENGAVAVAFDMNVTVPSVEEITGGNFVNGKYDATYNSGVFINGKWEPAIAKDMSDRIAYYQGDVLKRNIRYTTLERWNWRSGNKSTVVDGYVFSVSNDGILSVSYNGETVMQIR